jgi:hypothetical protein
MTTSVDMAQTFSVRYGSTPFSQNYVYEATNSSVFPGVYQKYVDGIMDRKPFCIVRFLSSSVSNIGMKYILQLPTAFVDIRLDENGVGKYMMVYTCSAGIVEFDILARVLKPPATDLADLVDTVCRRRLSEGLIRI